MFFVQCDSFSELCRSLQGDLTDTQVSSPDQGKLHEFIAQPLVSVRNFWISFNAGFAQDCKHQFPDFFTIRILCFSYIQGFFPICPERQTLGLHR